MTAKKSIFQLHLMVKMAISIFIQQIPYFVLTSLNVNVSGYVFLYSNGRCDPSQQGFGSVLLKALLDNMPLLPAAATGGMYTMFVIIQIEGMVVWHVLFYSLVK